MIQIAGETMTVEFREWSLPVYETFIRSKALPEYHLDYDHEADRYLLTCPSRFAHLFDAARPLVDHGWREFNDRLFDYEAFIVQTALDAKRYAIWADTGLGKTFMFLEWARQVHHRTGGKVLLIVPLNIISQTLDEIRVFYGDSDTGYPAVQWIQSRAELRTWCVSGSQLAIVNPEKFIPQGDGETVSELQHLAGVVLDEASILKAGGGKIKWALIKSCRGIEYKLACTATPAPNDTMEYASQGSFLEKLRSEGEVLWTFFCRDAQGEWKVKEHARSAFFRFMAGWSIYLRDPVAYGFKDNLQAVPKPVITEHVIPITAEQQRLIMAVPDETGQTRMFSREKLGVVERSKYSQIAKGFIYEGECVGMLDDVGFYTGKKLTSSHSTRIRSLKPARVAEIVRRDYIDGLQVLVWTVFDEEAEILKQELAFECGKGLVEVLDGRTPQKNRPGIIERFRRGDIPILITKARLLGFGLNLQNVGSMVYSGFSDSFEQFYQTLRRAVRYGQTKAVRIHIPFIRELEGHIWDNVQEKQARFLADVAVQERHYVEAMRGMVR